MYKSFFKRIFDVVLSLFALLVLGIPMLIVAIIVRSDVGSPVV